MRDFEWPVVGQTVRFRDPIDGFTGGVVKSYDFERDLWRVSVSDSQFIDFLGARLGHDLVLPRPRTWQEEFSDMLADAVRAQRRTS